MARLHARPGRGRPFDRAPRDRRASLAELHEFAALTRHASATNDPLHAGTEPARRLSDEITLPALVRGGRGDDGLRRMGGGARRSLEGPDVRQREDAGAARPMRTASRATACSRPVSRSRRGSISSGWLPTRTSRRCCSATCAAPSTATTSSRRAAARSTSSICCSARATWCATTPRCARGFQTRFKRIFVDEFQDTDPLQAEILLLLAADDNDGDRLAAGAAAARHAVPGRRSEAVDLPLPPRRRRRLP